MPVGERTASSPASSACCAMGVLDEAVQRHRQIRDDQSHGELPIGMCGPDFGASFGHPFAADVTHCPFGRSTSVSQLSTTTTSRPEYSRERTITIERLSEWTS